MSELELTRTPRGPAPFGWRRETGSPALQAIPLELERLEEAYAYLARGCSFRDVARWLTASTGRSMDHAHLWRAYQRRLKDGPPIDDAVLRKDRAA